MFDFSVALMLRALFSIFFASLIFVSSMAKIPISAVPNLDTKLADKQKALGIKFVEDWLTIDANTPYIKVRDEGLKTGDVEIGSRSTLCM